MQIADVAIIGGGASGSILAARLLESMPAGRVVLIDPCPSLGRGVAYGCDDPAHRLNVRAANMSAKAEDPGHFARWLEARNHRDVGHEFVSRNLFGEYVGDVLHDSQRNSNAELIKISDRAVSLRLDGDLTVGLQNGGVVRAKEVVLALGNLPPRLPEPLAGLPDQRRIVADPCQKNALTGIQENDRILFIGTSLTAVDCILGLVARGHKGQIIARSRHGLFPQCHAKSTPIQIEIPFGDELLTRLSQRIREGGENWRGVVDGLRPRTVEIWQSLSWKERGRFRHRLQAFWDVHRHRIPEDMSHRLDCLKASGQLDIGKGRLLEARAEDDYVAILLTNPVQDALEVDWIVNCTGPSADLKSARLPVIESAIANGLAEYDPLGMGLMVDQDGRTNDAGDVWTLGPLCRGCRLETTAIPEIRMQALNIAKILSE